MFVRRSGFLPPQDCRHLCEVYDAYAAEATVRDGNGEPVVYWPAILHLWRVRNIVADCVERLKATVVLEDRCVTPYVETVILCRIGAGSRHTLHADNCKRDGERWVPNHTEHRSHSAIVYLNEDFSGGELDFPDNCRIQPVTGLMVAFNSDERYLHQVLPVKTGVRYSMPIWFTLHQERALADLA